MNSNGMNLNIGLMVAGMVLAGSGMAAGQPLKFEPTLEAGKRYTLKTEQEGASQMAMGEVQMEQKVGMMMFNQIEAKKAEGGDVGLAMKIGRVKMELDVLGQKMEFDSDSPETAHPMLGGMVKPLAESSVTALLKADGTLADVKIEGGSSGGGGNPLGNIGIGPEIMADGLKGFLGEGFPEEAVEPGAEWDYGLSVPMAQMGKRRVAAHYKYEGMEAPEGSETKLAKVTFTGTLEPAAEGEGSSTTSLGGLNVALDVKEMTIEGVMYYDAEKRFFTLSKTTSKLVMAMNNGETTMEMPTTQTQVTTLEKVEDL